MVMGKLSQIMLKPTKKKSQPQVRAQEDAPIPERVHEHRHEPHKVSARVRVHNTIITVGMVIGSHIRHLLTETQFRRVFFACVLGLGLAIVNSAIW